jgi:hypothetical protein
LIASSWKQARPKELKKIVYALTEDRLKSLITDHEDRGWTQASEVKPYNRGLGCLMVWEKQ